MQELVDLEERGWEALSTGGEAATTFYGEVLDHGVVMLLPGGLVLDDRDQILEAMGGPPWASYRLESMRALPLGTDAGVVAYAVTAERELKEPYSALISSTYVRRGDRWRLAFHQQTPR